MEQDLSASVYIRNRGNVWIDDNLVDRCHGCQTKFTFLLRKHHCRNCGNIFCHKCTDQKIVIPHFIADRPNPADYWNISYYITSLRTNEEKVCASCYESIAEKTKSHDKIIKILKNPVDIDKIREFPESESEVKNHYYYHLRNIQYYLPNHKYSDIDKKMLIVNAHHFSGHSKYLLHLLKVINWECDDESTRRDQLEFVVGIINGEKINKCYELFCTRTCQEQLSCDDCVNILYSNINELPDEILDFLFEIIQRTPEQVILCHLPFFINLIITHSGKDIVRDLLFRLLSQTDKMIYRTFWLLSISLKTHHKGNKNIDKFFGLFDKDKLEMMKSEFKFYAKLVENLDDPRRYLLNNFDKHKPISIPYDPEIKLIDYNVSEIIIKDSHTKPVVIPFETTHGKKRLLFKKESVMNDMTVLNLMTLCDIILKEFFENNTHMNVVVYPVIPLAENYGMIEMVDEAETVHSIMNKRKTIYHYIFDKNENRKIADVMDRYMYSLVSYTLHGYFLGLGDRHLQNIMITDDGAIFHIDFGFILGKDAHPLSTSNIKLNSDMLDVIGGYGSNRYKTYLDLCAMGVIVLRKYFNMFFILLAQNTKLKEKYIEKFIMNRFQPRQDDSVVVTELMSIIKKSNDAYSDLIIDFIHYHSQEKTIQNSFGKIFNVVAKRMSNLAYSE